MSVYNDELTTQCVIEASAKVHQSFPALPKEFFTVFSDRIKENGFTDERLKEAINHVIDNCIYPTPSIAEFIKFDRSVKVYSYDQMIKMNDEYHGAFERYKSIKVSGMSKPMYASLNDIELYKLELFIPKDKK